ncbi:MAG: L,D-transpeptidase, partial [Hyphomicrobiaceae bacterium]
MLRFLWLSCTAISLIAVPVQSAVASIRVSIDISSQRMKVYVDGRLRHVWRVSTGRRGYSTPIGTFRPTRLERSWYSRKYNWSPMPYSIFFVGGVAIHGSYYIRQLGRRASHGCVRLAPRNAARLFSMV